MILHTSKRSLSKTTKNTLKESKNVKDDFKIINMIIPINMKMIQKLNKTGFWEDNQILIPLLKNLFLQNKILKDHDLNKIKINKLKGPKSKKRKVYTKIDLFKFYGSYLHFLSNTFIYSWMFWFYWNWLFFVSKNIWKIK